MSDPYRGEVAVLATKHGKAACVAPPLAAVPGLAVSVADVDTDVLGTFTGEVPRARPPRETAVAKARLGMDATGCPIGLATEGSFAAHPEVPWLTLHTEVAVLVDDTRAGPGGEPLVVAEQRATLDTNAARHPVAPDGDLAAGLAAVGFPHAGVVVRAGPAVVATGVRDHDALRVALATAAEVGSGVTVEADLRAHHNPLRRQVIEAVAGQLGRRLATACPACRTPGFGILRSVPGLRCADCGTPTTGTVETEWGCARCPCRRRHPVAAAAAPPALCPECNP